MITTHPFSIAITHPLPQVVLTIALLLLTAHSSLLTVAAQTATATLSGTVEDQNSAVIPGVSITLTNTANGQQREATTDDHGSYTIPLLSPGTYVLRAERQGFAPIETRNIVLNVGDQKSLQIELKAGDVNAEVQVLSEAPLINTSPAVTNTIDRTFVGNLPLNGRSFQSLILLTPGVTIASAGGNDFGQFSVNGQRASTNYFTVDGVSANIGTFAAFGSAANIALTGAYPGTSAFGGTNSLVSVEAVEEFKIQTSSYTAESGRQPGGQVQLVTRSGTNDFHGTLFEYLRNEKFDARNYFNKKPALKPPLRQNQFGGIFSGPIFLPRFGEGPSRWYNGKNRTFFFVSYEGQRVRQPNFSNLFVPSLRLRQVAAESIKPILNAFPLPTGPEDVNAAGVPRGWALAAITFSSPGTMNATSVRIDHAIGRKSSLFGRFNEAPSRVTTFTGGPFGRTVVALTRTLTIGMTSVFTTQLTNEFRINHSRQLGQEVYIPMTFGGAIPLDPQMLTSGYGGRAQASLSFGGRSRSFDAGDSIHNEQRQLNIVDNVSIGLGKHQLKFGIDYRRLSPTYAPLSIQLTRFSSEADVIAGFASSASITNYDSARPGYANLSVYGQDSWKASPRLTLDLGLRWEMNPAPTEADGKRPIQAVGVVGVDVSHATLAPAGTPFYKTLYTAFAPRLGLVYLLNKKNGRETMVRGGFGVYYDLGSAGATAGFPVSAAKSLARTPFPISAAAAARPLIIIPSTLPPATNLTAVANDRGLKLPYTLQWNLAIEQSLGTSQTVSISYVGSGARRLLMTQFLDSAGFFGTPTNPNFGGGILHTSNGPTSSYHSLQAQYRARFKRRFQALANYTWSHAIDEVSSDIQTNVLERGNADFDVRHNLSVAFVYDLPAPRKTRFFRLLLSGWIVEGIVHSKTGRPINVTGGSTVIRNALIDFRPDVIPGVPFYVADPSVPGGRRFSQAAFSSPPVGANGFSPDRQGTFGRNVLRQLPLNQTDLALGRAFNITESVSLRLKGEVFNVFNHPMFGGYINNFTDSRFGTPTLTMNSNSLSPGSLSPLYQIGGPRSVQVSARLSF